MKQKTHQSGRVRRRIQRQTRQAGRDEIRKKLLRLLSQQKSLLFVSPEEVPINTFR